MQNPFDYYIVKYIFVLFCFQNDSNYLTLSIHSGMTPMSLSERFRTCNNLAFAKEGGIEENSNFDRSSSVI